MIIIIQIYTFVKTTTLKDNLFKGVDFLLKDENTKEALVLIKENGTNYINLLREHIFKEDNMLFMMADMHLEEDQIKEIMKKFEELDKRQ